MANGLLGKGLEGIKVLSKRGSNALGHKLVLCLGKPTPDMACPELRKLDRDGVDGSGISVVELDGVETDGSSRLRGLC